MDLKEALRTLTVAAAKFVDGTPQYRRMEAARQALLEAITSAQLILSVIDNKGQERKPRRDKTEQVTRRRSPVRPGPAPLEQQQRVRSRK